jgi:UDP-GlcNAc:undecaprenyl-phosphate GlcNAc-1-phosphate transferase
VVLAVGVIDDRYDLPAWPQFAAQIAAAAIAVAGGILIERVTNPLGFELVDSLVHIPETLAVVFTLFWLIGATNTINFLDGVDGLAAGVVMVAALVLAAHSLLLGQLTIALLPLALAGACLGFLPYNFQPARITMGTCGSMFLGFSIGALAIIGGAKAATLLLVLGLPVVDTGWTILRRLARGQSPLRGDRTHLHHRLLELGLGERQIVLGMYLVCLALGVLALVLSTRLAKLYAIGVMAAATIALAILLTYLNRRRQRAPEPPPPG